MAYPRKSARRNRLINERQAVRALVLNPDYELLLIKSVEPLSGQAFWLTPGGGLEEGEDPESCLRRELLEETGLTTCQIGPVVWIRSHPSSWAGVAVLQHERFYLVQVAPFEPTARHFPDSVEQASFAGFRWWRVPEIEQSAETFVPRRLAALLRELFAGGPPATPIDAGA